MTTPTSPGADVSLDSPEASFETDFVNKTLYPETAQRGLGVRGAVPYARFWSENWFRIAVGDKFSLLDGNGRLLASDTVKSLAGGRQFLDVPRTQLPDGLFDLYLQVTRIGSGQVSVSPFVKYEVDTRTPAGIDNRPDLLGHDGLRVRPESLAQYSAIDPSYLTKGMVVLVDKFQNAGVNTEAEVNLGGVATNFILSPADIASPGPWRWFIPPSVFSQISQFGQVALLVTATNKVGNIPAGVDRYSPPFYLNSELNPLLYYGPLLLVANVETTRLDMATVGAQPLSVAATPDRSARITTPPNQIDVKVILIDGDNIKQTLRLPTKSHVNVRGEDIDAATLREPLRQLALRGGGFALISFELRTSTGALVGQSGSTQVQVLALQLPTTYPAPEFDSKPGAQTVNPQSYQNGALVKVAYPTMNTAQSIRLIWRFANGTAAVIPVMAGVIAGVAYFSINSQVIVQSASQTITVSYEVTEGGNTVSSDIQNLTFGNIAPVITYDLENFENVPLQSVSATGALIYTRFLNFRLVQKRSADDYISVLTPGVGYFKPHVFNRVLGCYLGGGATRADSMRFEIEVANKTSKRISFWLAGGNITIPNPSFTIYYLNSGGATLGSKTFTQPNTYYFQNEVFVDSGFIGDIKTIAVITNVQLLMDEFMVY